MSAPSLNTYLAELLADQQTLQTPVTRAATAHDLQPSAWRADRFREIIPLTAPGPGERYAFEVDLDSCSGCKACVSGCHSLNGLDEEETWRDVGVVHGLTALASSDSDQFINHQSQIINQTVTTACHHCEDPACLNGCPVLAYEKDPATGIVRHLDDQCIGCSYCVLKCPYDVPKYNERLGIVRKCDMCHGRLAAGEAPACAQACPTQAIKIVLIPAPGNAEPQLGSDSAASTAAHATLAALSGTDFAYTRPTTRYVSKNPLPTVLRAADAGTPRIQPAHLPLVFLLVGTQLSLGLLLASFAESQISNFKSQISAASALLFFAALAASVAHLGQPLRAWRIFLGLRRSWLSREAVVLGAAAPLVAATAALPHLAAFPITHPLATLITPWASLLAAAAIGVTSLGVFCSAMLYIDTRRHFWRPANTFLRMGGTAAIAALALVAPPAAALALTAKLALELISVRGPSASARLQRGPLLSLLAGRGFLGALAILLFALDAPHLGFACFAFGELLERALYFRAVDAPKMPGQPAARA